MAYVAVKGGERAIDSAHAWVAEARRGNPDVAEIGTEQIAELQPQVYEPAVASFLLDVYGLDPDIPWVTRLCGAEANLPRPSREPG